MQIENIDEEFRKPDMLAEGCFYRQNVGAHEVMVPV